MMAYIDRDAFVEKTCSDCGWGCKPGDAFCLTITKVMEAPIADVVQVGRCFECQEYDEDNEYCRWLKVYVCPHFYCAHNDRKDGDRCDES